MAENDKERCGVQSVPAETVVSSILKMIAVNGTQISTFKKELMKLCQFVCLCDLL